MKHVALLAALGLASCAGPRLDRDLPLRLVDPERTEREDDPRLPLRLSLSDEAEELRVEPQGFELETLEVRLETPPPAPIPQADYGLYANPIR